LYRIVCVISEKKPVVIWKGPIGRRFEVAILYENTHFHGLKSIQRYYKFRNYCIDCMKSYGRNSKHTISCKTRCYGCSNVGYEPCQNQPNVFITCEFCNRDYKNNQCYSQHLTAVCKIYKKCLICTHVYAVEKKHVCGESFCQKCHSMHRPERECYMQPLKDKKQDPYRLCVYDLETSQVKLYF
jgi:hypothetical protein